MVKNTGKFHRTLQLGLIAVSLITVYLTIKTCNKPKEVSSIQRDTSYVEIPIKGDIEYRPYPKIEIQYDTIHRDSIRYRDVDTNAILRDYFNTYVYRDTLKIDSLTLAIIDTMTENRIVARKVYYKYNKEVQVIKEISLKDYDYYARGSLGKISNGGTSLEVGLGYNIKNLGYIEGYTGLVAQEGMFKPVLGIGYLKLLNKQNKK